MQQKRGVRTIFLLLGFILAVSGCATNKNQVTYNDFELTVKSVPEGILLYLANIPPETDRIVIWVADKNPKTPPEMYYAGNAFAKADIRGSSLGLLKLKGKVFFPFVHTGHEYQIDAEVSFRLYNYGINDRKDAGYGNVRRFTNIIAENGNYYDNYLELFVNESRTNVTLSSEPVFPADIQLNPHNYRFGIDIKKDDRSSASFAPERSVDGKHWEFAPKLSREISLDLSRNGHLEKNGNYPTVITAYCNVSYDNISWDVEIARSPIFVYSHLSILED